MTWKGKREARSKEFVTGSNKPISLLQHIHKPTLIVQIYLAGFNQVHIYQTRVEVIQNYKFKFVDFRKSQRP